MDRHTLTDRVSVADLHSRGSAAVRDVLRVPADGDERTNRVELADVNRAEKTHVIAQTSAATDGHIGPDDEAAPDDYVGRDPGKGIDARGFPDQTRH